MTNAENEYIELAKHCIGLDYKLGKELCITIYDESR